MLTQLHLQELLVYEPESGKLFWKYRASHWFKDEGNCKRWNSTFAGKEAFTCKHVKGYKIGIVNSKPYKAHRVIWCLVNGDWPAEQIDHINGDKSDNRLVNLRAVSNRENSKNQKMRITNTSGYTGVNFQKQSGRWQVRISTETGRIYLGLFDNLEEAIAVRKDCEASFGYHKNHGRV